MEDIIRLGEFDREFFESISGNGNILVSEKGVYHTIFESEKKVGIVGYIPFREEEGAGFVQILVHPDFRGKRLALKAEELLVKRYNLTKLYSTIEKKNSASIKAHENAGFELIDSEKMNLLVKKGLLSENQIRFVKEF